MTTPVINWKITDLNTYSDKGVDGIIHSIKWQCSANDGQKQSSTIGSAILSYPDVKNFVPLQNTTKEMVEQWLFASFGEEGKNFIEQSVVNSLQSQNQIEPQTPDWLLQIKNVEENQ